MIQAFQIALSSGLWMVNTFLQAPKVPDDTIIINLTQPLTLNKFSFISKGERKIPPGSDLAQSDGWTELAAWALNSSSSENSENKNACPEMVPGQARLKLAWKYEREVVLCLKGLPSRIKAENGQLDRELILNTVWNDSLLISNEKYLGYLACV